MIFSKLNKIYYSRDLIFYLSETENDATLVILACKKIKPIERRCDIYIFCVPVETMLIPQTYLHWRDVLFQLHTCSILGKYVLINNKFKFK